MNEIQIRQIASFVGFEDFSYEESDDSLLILDTSGEFEKFIIITDHSVETNFHCDLRLLYEYLYKIGHKVFDTNTIKWVQLQKDDLADLKSVVEGQLSFIKHQLSRTDLIPGYIDYLMVDKANLEKLKAKLCV